MRNDLEECAAAFERTFKHNRYADKDSFRLGYVVALSIVRAKEVREVVEALAEAVSIIENICCTDNSADLMMDLSDFKALLEKYREA